MKKNTYSHRIIMNAEGNVILKGGYVDFGGMKKFHDIIVIDPKKGETKVFQKGFIEIDMKKNNRTEVWEF